MDEVKDKIDTLSIQLETGDSRQRREAAEMLALLRDIRAVYPLVKALGDGNKGVQQACTDALSEIGGEVTAYNVVPLLRDENAIIRNLAVEILQGIGSACLPVLLPMTRDKDPDIRQFACDILGDIGDCRAVEALVERLKDENTNIRSSAAASLGMIKDLRAVDPLIEALNDNEWVTFNVIESLTSLKSRRAIPAIIGLLDSKKDYIVCAVVSALGELGGTENIEPLLRLFGKPRLRKEIRNSAIKALYKLSNGKVHRFKSKIDEDTFLNFLLAALEEDDPEIQAVSIRWIKYFRNPNAVKPLLNLVSRTEDDFQFLDLVRETIGSISSEQTLLKYLNSENKNILKIVIDVLGDIKCKKALKLLIVLYEKEDEEVRGKVVSSIVKIKGREATEFLIRALKDENGHIRSEAARELGELKDKKAVDSLSQIIMCDAYQDVRENAFSALINIGGDEVLSLFNFLIDNRDHQAREMAARGLRYLGSKEDAEKIIPLLKDEDERVRKSALLSLSILSFEDVEGDVIAALSDEAEQVRLSAIQILYEKKGIMAGDFIIHLLNDSSMRVKYKATEVLGQIKYKKATDYLISFLSDGEDMLKLAAAKALGEIGGEEGVIPLQKLLKDEDPILREAAGVALNQIMES